MFIKYLLGIWMGAVCLAAFVWAPADATLGEISRIIFFHIPTAWVSVLGFLACMVYGVRYLRSRDEKDDAAAAVWAEIGLLFIVVATVSGAIFAKATWGAYWSWDPRQTSIFVLFLIYMAYIALRSAIDDPERRASLSSVYSIIAFVTVPLLVFVIPRLPGIQGLHPNEAIISNKLNMDLKMLAVFIASLVGFTGVSLWMFGLKMRFVALRLSDKAEAKEV
ncbi:MAG TPA: cytochrome c biogenesis protein [Bacillota bacterium]|nr:cytochrome c biogenesis protein [Bacillota bacterium]HOH09653.1 cytochrome c biogenesis protein [Bacillota bacterium]HOS50218.1 cytochrome c biogenesis protein [Bacillota bacterium]HOY90072.1 cytochrome c biogenesis protein [Bacillota bacterium]HPI00540.1 cytochrome c biogenesis protein [Bacillota bacterium]